MPSFKTLDPTKIQAILEARNEKGEKLYPDILTPLAEKEETIFKNSSCPKCGSYACAVTMNPKRPFSPGSPLVNKILRCISCGTEFDPQTRLILRATITDAGG